MPRDKLLFKYTGDPATTEHHGNIPLRDIHESDRSWLTDEQLVTLASSPIYSARNAAEEEAARAERRIEKEAVAAAPPEAVSVTVASPEAPAPKADAKK